MAHECAYVPGSVNEADRFIRTMADRSLAQLSKAAFLNVWHSISYLQPGLHPDGYDDPEGGWPLPLSGFAAEAWRRFEAQQLTEAELYPADAAWAGIFDLLQSVPDDESVEHRLLLATNFGLPIEDEE